MYFVPFGKARCPAMTLRLVVVCQLISSGFTRCTRSLSQVENEEQISDHVFVNENEAATFLGRHLLANRFDFELFTPGNLERECNEELCNFEEAREVFEDTAKTNTFWKEYIKKHESQSSRGVDVTALLIGLIAAGIAVVVIGLLFWYFCNRKCKPGRSPGSVRDRPRRSNASLIIRRLEEVSLQPVALPPEEMCPGLPSYEQAIAKSGPHDAPPPPYPGSRPGSIRR